MTLWEKLKCLLPSNRRARERDMQEELDSLQQMAEPRELGNLTRIAEDARDAWTWRWLEQAAQDVRYALRSMMHNKAFTTLAVLSLALGIGANTAIFSFMDSILLRPLPVPQPDTLVVMKWHTPKGFTSASSKGMSWSTDGSYTDEATGGYVGTNFPYPALKFFQENSGVLSSAFCYFGISRVNVTAHDETEAVKGQYVSGDYFRGMGIYPVAGRFIGNDDDTVGTGAVAVLSSRLSERRFGSAAQSLGQTIRLNDKPFVVIGIAPADFFGAEPGAIPDVYIPMHASMILQPTSYATKQFLEPDFYWIEVMGRLKPGVSIAQAQSTLAPQFQQFVDSTAATEKQRANPPLLTIAQGGSGLDSLRRKYAKSVYVLMAMVSLILLIACANIANLMLARAVARRREIAVRLSIGAGRMRIIRQLLTESVLLSCIGGALAIAFAWWGIRVLTLLLANGRDNFTLHAELNWHVLGITLALSVVTGLLFGLAPAIQATRADVMPALKEVRTNSGSVSIHRLWKLSSRISLSSVLIVLQVAISLLLLVAAGLFGRTLSNLHSIDLGFSRDNILLFNLNPGAAGYNDTAPFNYEALRERLSQMTGVSGVTLSSGALPSGGGTMAPYEILGQPTPSAPAGGRPPNMAVLFSAGPQFFDTMQIHRIAGRDFTPADSVGGAKVAIVNERFAKVFGLDNAVGHTLSFNKNTYEIVGMVRDALAFTLKEEYKPVVYFPYSGSPYGMTYEIRTSGNPLSLATTVRQIVKQTDPRLAVFDVKTQAEHIDQAISSEITLARLCSVFAGLALTIACVGLYGTVAFNVARRTAEIGIRMALGAQAARIVWMVVREVIVLALIGLAIGIPLVLTGSRFVKSFLYGIESNDPLAIVAAILLLLAAGLVAGLIPARRAASIDPMIAVRHD